MFRKKQLCIFVSDTWHNEYPSNERHSTTFSRVFFIILFFGDAAMKSSPSLSTPISLERLTILWSIFRVIAVVLTGYHLVTLPIHI
jgi:hypothetical protein